MEAIIFIGIILFIILIIVLIQYNKLIKLRNKVKQAESAIDVYLTQRFDLIPNLVRVVKEYTNHEETILTKITELREKYLKEKNMKDGQKLNNECNQLLVVIENYPDLKASEQYLNLQKSLTKMENQLQAARRVYNVEVTEYNTAINVFPRNIIGKLLGFREADLFEANLPNN